jgi:hypothetical protein
MEIILIVVLILIITYFFTNNYKYKLDKYFLKFITGKDLVICGNSPEYSEQIKKVNITNNTIIVRFNYAIYHIPENSKTDILIMNDGKYSSFMVFEYKKYMKYKKEQGIKYVFCTKQFLKYYKLLYYKYGIYRPTSGLLFIYFIIKHIDLVNSVTLVGFNLLNTGHYWNKKHPTAKIHEPKREGEIINELVNKYSSKMLLIK